MCCVGELFTVTLGLQIWFTLQLETRSIARLCKLEFHLTALCQGQDCFGGQMEVIAVAELHTTRKTVRRPFLSENPLVLCARFHYV